MASERTENRRLTFSTTPLSFDDTSPGKPCEYPHKPYIALTLYCQKRESLGYIFAAIFIQIFVVGSENACILKQSAYGPARSFKVIDFGTDLKRICNFLLLINSNLGPFLPRFRNTAGFL